MFGGNVFGVAPTPAPNPFGAPAPAFGASAPAFGAAPAPAFGAAAAPAFGAAPAPAFGTAPAPAFGATAPAFGAAPTPGGIFGTPAPAAPAANLFGAQPTNLFGPQAPSANLFGQQQPAQPQQPALQPSTLVTYSSKYEDLHPTVQQDLLGIQGQISAYRDDCSKLDSDPRLQDSAVLKKGMEGETVRLTHGLQAMLNAMRQDDEALVDFRGKVLLLLSATELAVRTYMRAKMWREAPQMYRGQTMPAQVQELLSTHVVLPSPYLQQAVQGFQEVVQQYSQCIAELEQAVPRGGSGGAGGAGGLNSGGGGGGGVSHLDHLPLVVNHMHDFFVHIAARMEELHAAVARAREAFLANRRATGDLSDPFADSRRYHQLAMAAAAKRVAIPPASSYGAQAGQAGLAAGAAGAYGAGGFGTPAPGNGFALGSASPFGTPLPGGDPQAQRPVQSTNSRRRR